MKDKVKKYEKEIADRNDKLQNCKVNMEEKDAIIRVAEATNAQKEAHINNLQSQIVKLKSYKKTTMNTLVENEKKEKQIKDLESKIQSKANQLKAMQLDEARIKSKKINQLTKELNESRNDNKSKKINQLTKRIGELEGKLKDVRSIKDIDDDIQSIEKIQIQKVIIPEITIIDNEPEEQKQNRDIAVSEFQFDSENAASKPKRLKTEIKPENN